MKVLQAPDTLGKNEQLKESGESPILGSILAWDKCFRVPFQPKTCRSKSMSNDDAWDFWAYWQYILATEKNAANYDISTIPKFPDPLCTTFWRTDPVTSPAASAIQTIFGTDLDVKKWAGLQKDQKEGVFLVSCDLPKQNIQQAIFAGVKPSPTFHHRGRNRPQPLKRPRHLNLAQRPE